LYRYFVSQCSEFCGHNPLCCFSTSVCCCCCCCCCCLFRHLLSPETFGYTLICLQVHTTYVHYTVTKQYTLILFLFPPIFYASFLYFFLCRCTLQYPAYILLMVWLNSFQTVTGMFHHRYIQKYPDKGEFPFNPCPVLESFSLHYFVLDTYYFPF